MQEHEKPNQVNADGTPQDPNADCKAGPQDLEVAGDDVMNILAGVEDQFDRLRDLDDRQDQAVATLAERSAAIDRREAALDERFRELEAQREQLASAGAAGNGTGDAERQRLARELDESQGQLTLATTKLAEFSSRLAGQVSQLAAGASAIAQSEEQSQEIERLKQQLAQCGDAEDSSALREARERMETLAAELATAKAAEAAVQEQLNELSSRPEAAEDSRGLRAESMRLAEQQESLEQREANLERIQKKLQEHGQASHLSREELARHAQEVRLLRKQQGEVAQSKAKLNRIERTLIKKWARPRSVMTVARLCFVLSVTAVGSWFAADRMFPATVVASVDLQASPQEGAVVKDETLAQWQHWHKGLLFNDNFHLATADRMAARRVESFMSAAAVASLLTDHLSVDDGQPGLLTLSLATHDPDQAQELLDVIASTMAAESEVALGPEAELTVGLSTRKEDGQLRYAWVNPIPIEDERLFHASLIFGGAVVVMLVLYGILTTRFSRTRGFVDDDEDEEVGYMAPGDEGATLRPLAA